jgi:anti-anti-sigma factor
MRRGGGAVSGGDVEEQEGSSFSSTVQRLPAGITIIRANGDLDSETSSQLYVVVTGELRREPAQLVLELSNLKSLDSAAVEALVSVSASAGESDISFCLVASNASPVVRTLAQGGLIERFEVFPTVCAATSNR